mmetsp:Transcript_68511/g.149650  ORF Transcript_68511/g.149650 Transcript_68511/m.149650 type:complete len:251 (+) Transcript_68511:68-820(+)
MMAHHLQGGTLHSDKHEGCRPQQGHQTTKLTSPCSLLLRLVAGRFCFLYLIVKLLDVLLTICPHAYAHRDTACRSCKQCSRSQCLPGNFCGSACGCCQPCSCKPGNNCPTDCLVGESVLGFFCSFLIFFHFRCKQVHLFFYSLFVCFCLCSLCCKPAIVGNGPFRLHLCLTQLTLQALIGSEQIRRLLCLCSCPLLCLACLSFGLLSPLVCIGSLADLILQVLTCLLQIPGLLLASGFHPLLLNDAGLQL